IKPGAIAWPPASTTVSAAPDNLPISTILPSLTATSPWNDGMPEPSTTRPFLIKTSYAIGFLLFAGAGAVDADYSIALRPVVSDCAPSERQGMCGGHGFAAVRHPG